MSNQLKNESSPYLRQHSNNPVEWFAWNKVSLNKAKKERKPITSVIVVTKTLDAIAGSILNFLSATGIKIPNKPDKIIFNIIDIEIIIDIT